jgi:hypothetical protein
VIVIALYSLFLLNFEFQDKEHVEEVDQKSSSNHVEISAHDMVSSCLLSITVSVETLLS